MNAIRGRKKQAFPAVVFLQKRSFYLCMAFFLYFCNLNDEHIPYHISTHGSGHAGLGATLSCGAVGLYQIRHSRGGAPPDAWLLPSAQGGSRKSRPGYPHSALATRVVQYPSALFAMEASTGLLSGMDAGRGTPAHRCARCTR